MTIETVELGGGDWRFRCRVAGPPGGRLVILLHGFPQTSFEWRHQLEALAAEGYRAVAPDQRGYSPGARPDGVANYRVDHLVSDVVAIADEIGGHQFDLVGHDWGAIVAWYVAGSYGQRLRTLTTVSVPHPKAMAGALAGSDEQRQKSGYVALFRQEGVAEQGLLANDGQGLRQLLLGTGVAEPGVTEYVEVLTEPGALTAALNYYRAMRWDDPDAIGEIEVPTLFVWSSDDMAIGREAAERCVEHVDGPYRFEVLDGVSHWIPEEAPGALNTLLLAHLGTYS